MKSKPPSDEHISLDGPPSEEGVPSSIEEKKASVQAPMLQVLSPALYEQRAELGRGGLGQVTRVMDLRLMREVALKQLLPQKQKAQERFLREALITARLQHPSIVPVYEVGFWPSGEPFYSMKMVTGSPLKVLIERAQTLEARLALLPHILAASEALAYAHSQKIIHRDLKPQNILVGEFGETVVIDWGIAKDLNQPPELIAAPLSTTHEAMVALNLEQLPLSEGGSQSFSSGADLTMAGAILGTPAYMPMEQAKGNPVDERADVYSLGAVLYHLLSGVPPYSGPYDKVILRQVLQNPPIPLQDRQEGVPRDLLGITQKAMSRNAEERYATARELADDLRKFQTGQLVGAHQYSTWELVRRWLGRHRVEVLLAAGLSVALLLTVIFAFARITKEKELAQGSQREAEEQRATTASLNERLLLKQARLFLDRNPAQALSWLKQMRPGQGSFGAIRTIAADAISRGIPRAISVETPAELLTFSPDGKWMASAGEHSLWLWDFSCAAPPCGAPHRLSEKSERISSLRFSPDSKTLAAAGAETTIQLWDVNSRAPRVLSGHTKSVGEVAFSPDGRWLASGSSDQHILLWDLSTGTSRRLGGEHGVIGDVAFSPDSHSVAVISWDGFLRVYRAETATLFGEEAVIGGGDVEFSPDSTMIAAASDDGSIYLWTPAHSKLTQIKGHENVVTRVRFSRDGRQLASASWDHTVRLWDLSTESPVGRVLFGHEQNIQHLEFSPDGKLLASAGQDDAIRLWDLSQGAMVLDRSRVLRGTETSVSSLAFSPGGRYLASANSDDFIRLWEVSPREGQPLEGHREDVRAVAYAPDGASFASAGMDKTIRLWRPGAPATLLGTLRGHEDGVLALAYSPDGERLVSVGELGAVFLWDVSAGTGVALASAMSAEELPKRLPYHDLLSSDLARFVGRSVAYSPDGRLLAYAALDARVHVYELSSGRTTLLDAHQAPITQLMFSPDNRALASASFDGEIFVHQLGAEGHRSFIGHKDAVYSLAFSPDGRLLASGGYDAMLRVWEVSTGAVRVFEGHQSAILDVTFSPDGARLASASFDQDCLVWSLSGGAPTRLKGHKRRASSVAFSPDGARLASASFDGTVRLWDISSGEVRVLRGHTDEVYQVLFSPDGRWLISGGRDDKVYLWSDDLPTEEAAFFTWLHQLVTPLLDPEE